MRVPPLALLVMCATLIAALANYFSILNFYAPSWLIFLELVFGFTFLLPAIASFVKNKTTVSPIAPSNASTLVTDGIFGISRNPMYVGMLLILVAIALWFQALSGTLGVLLFFITIDRLQIRVEEAQLRAKFGQSYLDYTKRVPRWLIVRGGVA